MNIQQIKDRVSISDFLSKHDILPKHSSGGQLFYAAPYRPDGDPSLVVKDGTGLWYDHGRGQGGSVIELAKLLYNTEDVSEVISKINELCQGNVPKVSIQQSTSKQLSSFNEFVSSKPLGSNYAITSYISSRGVHDASIQLNHVLQDVYYDYVNKEGAKTRYFGLGWQNESGGYSVRNKYTKTCVGKHDLTYLRGTTEKYNLFEGMFDLLSAISEKTASEADHNIVLNSGSFTSKAIDIILKQNAPIVRCFFDNGTGGDHYTNLVLERRPDAQDMRILYTNFKDYNELIQANLTPPTSQTARR